MATYDPIELGEHAQHSYAQYLIGNNQRGYQTLLDNFEHEGENDVEKAFIRSKGPYLEGVPSARWSSTSWRQFSENVEGRFAPNGLEEPLIRAFEEEGFRNLQRHQEKAIEHLVKDKHALIAAGTGRGKTESWFIPILQYSLRAKRGKIDGVAPESIKAVITYPTKALAQDQLKRFIEYLWIANQRSGLQEDQYLTIGVYDGDTPRRGQRKDGKDTHKYLEDSFDFFELPELIAEELADTPEVLESVAPNLHVKKRGNEYYLQTRGAYGNKYLKFVYLTRDKIEESPPDILLTNPDTVNYRLFNINDERSHQLFVDQPKFLVFDEVHTYEGLFGAHVSMLIKRLRRLREARDVGDTLRMIASSATVGQKEELFQRLFGVPHGSDYEIIQEDTSIESEDRVPAGTISEFAKENKLDTEVLTNDLQMWYEDEEVTTHTWVTNLGVDPEDVRGPEAVIDRATAEGELNWIKHLHQVLQDPTNDKYSIDDAPTPRSFVNYIETTYDIDEQTAEHVADSALKLFEITGYEIRVHVFNWPVDGYYKCLHCHTIYEKPQSCDCGEGESQTSFVTKIRLCQKCGEQAYEAWFCPDCGDVRPVRQETEGEYLYASEPECSHPNHGDLVRIYFVPDYECEDCGRTVKPTTSLGSCKKCGGVLTRTGEGVVCKNPECEEPGPEPDSSCTHCGGSLSVSDEISRECNDPECALHGTSQEGLDCSECNAPLIPKKVLPWVCTDENHAGKHPPENLTSGCDCGRSTFVLPGYLDVQEADYCTQCNKDRDDVFYLPGTGCTIHGDEYIEREQKSFGLKAAYRDADGNIRLETPSKAGHALPCYHRYRDFDHLMRSPINTGVTMSQFMLRKLADDNTDQKEAKLMSFADSYRDMERLANDFDEPERLLFIQQQILSTLEEVGEISLEKLINQTASDAREYWNSIGASDDIIDDIIGYREWRGTITGELIEGSYRLFHGEYDRTYGRLVSRGLANIRFKDPPASPDHREICEELLEGNRVQQEKLLTTLRDKRGLESPTRSLSELEEEGLIRIDEDYDRVELNTAKILVREINSAQPIRYLPASDSFVSDIKATVSNGDYTSAVNFEVPYTERTTLKSPHFDRDAFWAAETQPRMLLSKVYKGDLPADERRRLEHEFKRNSTPNFFSTGPAMEIGIDIGDLNTLMLLGSPPNTNAYLQRIGRAGRSDGKSLVNTISKRNPIDFYYHKKPQQLISSTEKPIPLDQHNEYVMKNSLTWAIVDYIATFYHIPWEQLDEMGGKQIKRPQPSNWDQFKKSTVRCTPPNEYKRFTQLYHSNVEEAFHGESLLILSAITENDDGVRAWLEDLLDYAYCRNCGHIYDSSVRGQCTNCDTDQELRVAREEYRSVIDDAIEHFEERLVKFAHEYHQDLQKELESLEDERDDLREVVRDHQKGSSFGDFSSDDGSDDSIEKTKQDLEKVRTQLRTIEKLLEEYADSTLAEIHGRSAQSGFVPQLRAFGEGVSITRHRRHPKTGEIITSQDKGGDRSASMALRELHPYAYNLKSKRGYVVTRVHEDTEGTKELQEKIGVRIRCRGCGTETEWTDQTSCPECGRSDHKVNKVTPISLKRVELSDKERKYPSNRRSTDVYPLTDYHTSPRNTFAHVETRISEFEPERSLTLSNSEDTGVLTIEHGELEITETVDSFTTSYSDGQQDPAAQTLTVCRESHCNSVVTKNKDDEWVCLRDSEHDPSKQEEVMVGRTFTTKGIRLSSDFLTPKTIHGLSHGFRLALQRIGGVEVRQLQESYEENATEAYIFESTAGGNGVTDLLFNSEGGRFVELEDALKVMAENIEECDCSTGCPECIYQYGCDQQNDERTFDKQRTSEVVESIRQCSESDTLVIGE